MLAWGRLIVAADAMLHIVEEITRKKIDFGRKGKDAVVIFWERLLSAHSCKDDVLMLYCSCG